MVSTPFRFARTAALATFLVVSWSGIPLASSRAASSQTPSPASSGTGATVQVSTESDLQAAVAAIASDTTIVLAPGTYKLTKTLTINGPFTNIALRGATENANDVVLVGTGMSTAGAGAVADGIAVGGSVQGVTIANLTIRDIYSHAIVFNKGTEAPVVRNVHLIDAGDRFIQANPDGSGGGVDDGVVESSVIEYTSAGRAAGASAIEVAAGSGWSVRRNAFRNVKAPKGQLAGPAVLMWQGARNSIVDGNLFLNCQSEIAFGAEDRTPNDHEGGIIRNNFIFRDGTVAGGVAIQLADSPNSQVLHNTILVNRSYATPIEYRFADTAGVQIVNNLLDGRVVASDGATASAVDNNTSASAAMFVNAAAGDLHLVAGATAAIDRVSVVMDAASDFDGDARPQGAAADYGADEYAAGTSSTTSSQSTTSSTSPSTTTSTTTTGSTSVTSTTSTLAATTTATTTALPSPWVGSDIGNPQVAGTASWANGSWTVQGAGTDIGGNADQFMFVYQTLDGDGEIVARVDSLDRTRNQSKAGVMIRDELTGGAKHASALVQAGGGVLFQRRIATDATSTQTSSGRDKAPVWLKVKRTGDTFTASKSVDGVTWTDVGSEVVYMNRLAYVGLAVTSRAARSLTTAGFSNVNVAVTPSGSGGNQLPSVSLTNPTAGATFTASSNITLSASASDPDGTVSSVDFYSGTTLIGSDSTSPYSVTWNNVPAGSYSLTAVAKDNAGASATSAAVAITVNTATNAVPTVSLTSPASGATFTAPANITLAANAADSDGTIARVDFYSGSTLIGSDTSSPYSVAWNSVAAGSYTLTAVARDNAGATATSAAVSITVNTAANAAPTVSLTSPTSGATFTAPANITLAASAADSDGTISWVDFFAGSTLIGSDTTSPYGGTWGSVPAGSYTLTAVAHDNSGNKTTSAPVTITVGASATLPTSLVFTASPDNSLVTSYGVRFFVAGADPATATPVKTMNIGKPTPVNGDITVDISSTVQSLPAGTYFMTATATDAGGTSQSAPSQTFVR